MAFSSCPISLLCTATAIVIVTLITCLIAPELHVVKISLPVVVHPRDVLPLLPKQVSWPVLKSLHSAVDLIPTFIGYASSVSNIDSDDDVHQLLEWKGACFYNNTAWLELHNKSGSEFGGGTLHIKVLYSS